VLISAMVGAVGGAAVFAAHEHGHPPGALVCIAIAALVATWPLTWMATFSIARPLRHLAMVADELRSGKLDGGTRIEAGPNEVGEVASALREMADRVAKQLRDQRALMAAVSHELRSPLARARVLVEMAREGTAPTSVNDDLEAEIEAMDGLVGDLLAAARIDFEAVSPRELEARDVALRALEIAGRPAESLVIDGTPGVVHADATLIGRAIAGLLDNATRHGGTNVVLRIVDRGERVRFEVDDDGHGFQPGDEERAFQPFWRAPPVSGAPKPRGEGLGLALVRQIAEAHGGIAGAHNLADHGARVWLELPR
jgi:two-component system OmpR family sensor kinase